MSKKYYILVFIFASFHTFQLKANNYVWLHGLYDNDNCWKIYNESYTSGIGIQSKYACKYSDGSSNSIYDIAQNVWYNSGNGGYNSSDANYRLGNKKDMILIGHSLGGLAAREIEFQYGKLKDEFGRPRVKGIITIGTPHQGAFIENSIAQGEQRKFLSKTLLKFTLGATLSATAFIGPYTWGKAIVLGVTNVAIIPLTNGLLVPLIEENMADGSAQCEKDMQVGSAYMQTISNRKVNVPILCFAAEEDRWSAVRLAHCAKNKTELQTNANLNTDGSYDKSGYNIMQGAQIVCYTLAGVHAGCAVGAIALGWWNPFSWYAAGLNIAAGVLWTSNGVYLNNGFDYDYSVLLGSYAYEQRTFSYQNMVCNDGLPAELVKGKSRISSPDNCDYETVYYTTTVAVPCSHDGTVSTYSQLLDRTKGTNVIWAGSSIKGVNHMEEFNHYKTKEAFRLTIEQGANGPVFKK